jgi:hypothetical protein
MFMSIDGQGAAVVSNGQAIDVDTKTHSFTFTCDVCVQPETRGIGEGDDDQAISVVLKLKDALLVVQGDPTATYQVSNHPGIVITQGAAAAVPMTHASDFFQIVQLPSGKTQTARLSAGKTVTVTFPD